MPTNYTLSLSASAIPDGAGSTFATAAAITPTTRNASVTDFVGPGDTTDTYAITLATPGTLNLRLTGAGLLQGGATLSLVNAFNGSLAFSAATQIADGLVTQALGAGTYYAVISAAASTDNAYTLSYSLGAPVVGAGGLRDTAGNTPATARSIGTLGTSSTSYPEFIGASDTADYYTFTVVAPVIVSFDVTGLSNAAALELDGVDGPLNDGAYDNSAAGLTASLAAGTYWFSIQGNADTPYNLRVVSTLIPDGAGSSRATGRAVGVLGTTPQSFSDYVGNGDEYDDYTFSLTAESTVSFSVTGATSDVGAYLTTAAGTQLLFDDFGQVRDLSIARTLAAGSYDFLVRNGGSIFSSNYTLTMSAAPLGAPVAPTLQAAGTLGALGLPTRSDLNGDGKTDLVWRRTDGTIVDWTMNGSTITSGVAVGTLGTDWTLLANADLNGDGNADLVWRQDSTGTIVDWTMKGATTVSGAVVGTLGADWSLLGTGDLNGDGNSDLIWRNASGTIVDWQMNGAVVTSGTTIGTLGADWTLLGTGDFNRDGRSDLLWQQSGSGTIVEWDMSRGGHHPGGHRRRAGRQLDLPRYGGFRRRRRIGPAVAQQRRRRGGVGDERGKNRKQRRRRNPRYKLVVHQRRRPERRRPRGHRLAQRRRHHRRLGDERPGGHIRNRGGNARQQLEAVDLTTIDPGGRRRSLPEPRAAPTNANTANPGATPQPSLCPPDTLAETKGMPLRRPLALLAIALLATPALLTPAKAAGPVPPAAHRALYDLTLESSRGGETTGARGTMAYEVTDACDGWATRQRLALTITNRDGQDVETVSDYATWESKDGLSLRFKMRQTTDTALTDQAEGDAHIDSPGGTGTIHYTLPEDHRIPMPKGTVFPMAHTEAILAAAAAGKKFIALPIFDGTGDKGTQDSAIAITNWAPPAKGSGLAANPVLAALPSGRVRIAFYDRDKPGAGGDKPAGAADYEVGMRYWANGVADDLHMDFGDFVMQGRLKEFTLQPPHC